MAAWHEDDRFWNTVAPWIFFKRRWLEADAEADQLIKLSGIKEGASVLDLCCGPGRHSLELARRSYQVVGVDRTQSYVVEADRKARAAGLKAEFVCEDMRKFRRQGAFDAVLNLYTSFGYFNDPADDAKVLENIRASLKPGGKLVMEMLGKEVLARIFRERDWSEEDGIIVLRENKLSQNWGWIDSRWISVSGNVKQEMIVSHRLYSACELTSLLNKCGFGAVSVFGDLAGAPYDQNAKRLVIVASA